MEVNQVPDPHRHRRQRPAGRYHPLDQWVRQKQHCKCHALQLEAKLEYMPELQNFQVTWLGYGRACQLVSLDNEFYFGLAEYTWPDKTKCMSLLAAIEQYEQGNAIGKGANPYPKTALTEETP